jgi:ABC-type transporter Mla subunit MlaD
MNEPVIPATATPARKLPPSPVLPADAPPMPGGVAAVPVREKEFSTKFDLNAGNIQLRQTAQNAQQAISSALRNLHQTSVQLRQTVAALNEEQRKLWEEMQDVAKLGDVEGAAEAFEGLVKQFEA